MNIFTAAVAGFAIVIKKIGIAFKAVLTGTKILIVSVSNFMISVITTVVNAILSAIKWVWTQIVNLTNFLFRTYLRLEAGCVPPVQKFVGLMIRLRWGFVIVSVLYAVYQYLGIKSLVVAIAVCGGLVAIGYSEAEKEEEEWNVHLDKLNSIIVKYLKYLIRLAIMAFSVYSLHLMFRNNIATFSVAALLASVILYTLLQFRKKADKECKNEEARCLIEKNCELSRTENQAKERKLFIQQAKELFAKKIFPIIMATMLLFCIIGLIIYIIYNLFKTHAS